MPEVLKQTILTPELPKSETKIAEPTSQEISNDPRSVVIGYNNETTKAQNFYRMITISQAYEKIMVELQAFYFSMLKKLALLIEELKDKHGITITPEQISTKKGLPENVKAILKQFEDDLEEIEEKIQILANFINIVNQKQQQTTQKISGIQNQIIQVEELIKNTKQNSQSSVQANNNTPELKPAQGSTAKEEDELQKRLMSLHEQLGRKKAKEQKLTTIGLSISDEKAKMEGLKDQYQGFTMRVFIVSGPQTSSNHIFFYLELQKKKEGRIFNLHNLLGSDDSNKNTYDRPTNTSNTSNPSKNRNNNF